MAATSNTNRTLPRRTEGWVASAIFGLILLGGLSCARHGPDTGSAESRTETALVVDNHHWSDVIVYLLHDEVVERIGVATAVQTSTFIIPSRRLGGSGLIRLRGHPVGAPDSHTTDAFVVQPGQEIEWTLESDLAHSSVAVH
jgi:hypothetical protein